MLEFRRNRTIRRGAGAVSAVTALVVLLAAPLVGESPAQAFEEDTPQTIQKERRTPEVPQSSAPKSSGPTGCTVEVGEGTVRRTEINTPLTQDKVVTVIEEELGEGIYGPPKPQAIDVDEIPSESRGQASNEIERQKIVDGKVELSGVPYNVYKVYGCDGYEDGREEVVFAPPAATSFIPSLQASLLEILPVPTLELLPFDDENDWTYVQTPIDIRSDEASLGTFEYTIDTGGPDQATPVGGGGPIQIRRWMTITATPRLVIFESGDDSMPGDTGRVECTREEALAEYIPETPGACSFRYRNSSSIADGNAFKAALKVEWDVTYIRNDGPPGSFELDGPTINAEDIRVAEVKVVNI